MISEEGRPPIVLPDCGLSEAELEIALKIVDGVKRKQIAIELGKSIRSIEHRVNVIKNKLQVSESIAFPVLLFVFLVHRGHIDAARYGLSAKPTP